MLVFNPQDVRFGVQRWRGVRSIAVDRQAAREIVEWGDGGPHVVFADVPRSRVRVRIVMEATADLDHAPVPGQAETLRFDVSPAGADGQRRRVEAACVVLAVTHDLGAKSATRAIDCVAVSADGEADPLTITDAGVTP